MEHDPTDEELNEAEALARALDRGTGSPELPEDAFEAAALLRYSADGGELDADRKQAILETLLSTAKVREPDEARSPLRWLAWVVPVFGVAAVALFVVLGQQGGGESAPTVQLTATALPQPSSDLLQAQAATAAGDEGAVERLSTEMRAHRTLVFAALTQSYEARSAAVTGSSRGSRSVPMLSRGLPVLMLVATGCAATAAPAAGRWVGTVEDAHTRAATAMDAGDYASARAVLEDALSAVPPGSVPDEDRRVVHQDLRFTLAEVALAEGDPAGAREQADAGLELGRAQDLYTANLLVVRGRALVDEGSDVEAASDYYEALEINDALLRRNLGR